MDKARKKVLYSDGLASYTNMISPYLVSDFTSVVSSSLKPLFGQKPMFAGNKPCDYEEFKNKCPQSLKWIKRMVGATEFINNKERYCLWLVGCSPNELR